MTRNGCSLLILLFFLGFIVFVDGVYVNQAKVEAILECPTFKNIYDVKSFHELAYIYKQFIHNFSFFYLYIIDCFKEHTF
jgi:hypothetical protein